MFYALEITIDWCRNVYSTYPITHNHIDTQKNRDSFFQSPSPKATDPFLTALPNTEPRFLSLVSTLLESVPTSFTQIRQRILPCSVRLLPPCYHPSLCSAKKELSNHQSPSPTPSAFFVLFCFKCKKWTFWSLAEKATVPSSAAQIRWEGKGISSTWGHTWASHPIAGRDFPGAWFLRRAGKTTARGQKNALAWLCRLEAVVLVEIPG